MGKWRNEDKYDNDVERTQEAFPTVPTYIIKGVIAQESGFDEKAFRVEANIGDASRGLMQLLLRTAQGLGFGGRPESLFLPSLNLYYGTRLLSDLFRQTRDWGRTFSAYNGGKRPRLGFGTVVTRSGIRCMGRIVPVGEFCNQKYVDNVMRKAAYFARKEGVPLTALPFPCPPEKDPE